MMNNDAVTPMNQGGTQSKRVTVGLYPMVAAMVGKKSIKDSATSKKNSAVASNHTIQSVRVSTRPDSGACFCSQLRISSSILFWTRICSSGVSHEAGVMGKSDITWKDAMAIMHVKPPSMKNSHLGWSADGG